MRNLLPLIACLLISTQLSVAAEERLFLGRGANTPTVFFAEGIGTEHAVAKARETKADAYADCEAQDMEGAGSSTPEELRSCATDLLGQTEATVVEIGADCPAGKLRAHDGNLYSFAGIWRGDQFSEGRSRWEDAKGEVQPFVRASIGYALPGQFDFLCPGWADRLDKNGHQANAGHYVSRYVNTDQCDQHANEAEIVRVCHGPGNEVAVLQDVEGRGWVTYSPAMDHNPEVMPEDLFPLKYSRDGRAFGKQLEFRVNASGRPCAAIIRVYVAGPSTLLVSDLVDGRHISWVADNNDARALADRVCSKAGF